ncbi:hypothetical protein E2C01_078802 [Portunus trituberculatus]|uniref:Uncharacterized protein n=1 Tax=Portunus trituberculatus TaxID=210409 RepID=A0A5B7IR40_PORTR|nr:hypothetical protein [Portunus trituberculatus]
MLQHLYVSPTPLHATPFPAEYTLLHTHTRTFPFLRLFHVPPPTFVIRSFLMQHHHSVPDDLTIVLTRGEESESVSGASGPVF